MTAPCQDYEVDMGRAIITDLGYAEKRQPSMVEHALYYEFNAADEGANPYIVKYWLFNAVTSRASEELSQNTDSVNESYISHTGTCKGIQLMDSTGLAPAKDADGFDIFIMGVRSIPTDTGYATFGDTVPVPNQVAA